MQLGGRVLSAVVGTLVLVSIGVVLSYFLLERQEGLSAGLVELLGGEDTVGHAYLSAVDEDLESVFFGNLVFVAVMSVLAIATYWGNEPPSTPGSAGPADLRVGRAYRCRQSDSPRRREDRLRSTGRLSRLAGPRERRGFPRLRRRRAPRVLPRARYPPSDFIQPYITGQQLDMVMMMFGYILGPILFGWYGFFLLPILFIVMLEAIRIVLPELIHGETLSPDVSMGDSIGADPPEARGAAAESEETSVQSD
jgi:hypothetical protein